MSSRKGVFRLPEDMHAWNVDGSSTDQLLGCSWIEYWENETGLRRGKCSYKDCTKVADQGGHIWLKRRGVVIAPICRGCNYSLNLKRQQDIGGNHSFLRKGTTVVKSEITPDMKYAERRFVETEIVHERTCIDCATDISDRPDNHDMCLQCYRRNRSKRRCIDCNTDISNQPENHEQCLDCFSAASTKRSFSSTFSRRSMDETVRACQNCSCDISDRPENHVWCLTCFHVIASKKRRYK